MSTNASSHKFLIAALSLAGALLTAAVGLMTIGGAVLAIGIWKGNIDQRMSAQESAQKEQIAALSANTDRQVQAVSTASRDMVAKLEQTTTARFEVIERDRSERIQEATRWRAEQGATTAKLETLVTGQQRQLETLTQLAERQRGKP